MRCCASLQARACRVVAPCLAPQQQRWHMHPTAVFRLNRKSSADVTRSCSCATEAMGDFSARTGTAPIQVVLRRSSEGLPLVQRQPCSRRTTSLGCRSQTCETLICKARAASRPSALRLRWVARLEGEADAGDGPGLGLLRPRQAASGDGIHAHQSMRKNERAGWPTGADSRRFSARATTWCDHQVPRATTAIASTPRAAPGPRPATLCM